MNPTIYTPNDHSISLSEIDPDALRVIRALQKGGYTTYVVGGGVRDLLLKQLPKDYDISTSAKPEEIKALFKGHCLLIGRRFRLAHIRFGRKTLEVATFRAGGNESSQLILHDNEWGTPEQDVLRRDFTINGLFYDPETETIIDYIGGYTDLKNRHLKTIGQPYLRFRQDPVRMIRLIKFQARLKFEVDPEVRIALAECRLEIMKSSQARIFEEILRMLESGSSESFIRLMSETGFLEYLMPPLAAFLQTGEGEDTFTYLQEVDSRCSHTSLDRSLLLCCFIFPFFVKHLQVHFIDRGKIPHWREIYEETDSVLLALFRPFFLLPRKFRVKMVSILTDQYRMTPFEKRPHRKPRIPRDADFPLALELLDIRACLEPGLKATWESWKNAFSLANERRKSVPKKRALHQA